MNNSEAKELSVIVGVYSIIPTQKALSFLRDTSETEKVKKILCTLSKEDMLNEVRTSCPKHQGSQDRSEQGAVQQLRHPGKQGWPWQLLFAAMQQKRTGSLDRTCSVTMTLGGESWQQRGKTFSRFSVFEDADRNDCSGSNCGNSLGACCSWWGRNKMSYTCLRMGGWGSLLKSAFWAVEVV